MHVSCYDVAARWVPAIRLTTSSLTNGCMNKSPRHGSLLVIFLTVFIDLLGFGMVLPLLPIYAKQFATDESGVSLGLLMASFSAMQFIFAPLWGRLSDRIGRRPVLMVGLAGSVVFYSLFGIATVLQSLPLLFVARIGAGVAGATISTAHAYIADSTSLQNRPKGMALIGLAFGLGFTVGPLFGALALPWEEITRPSFDPSAIVDASTATSVTPEHIELGPWPGYAAAMLSGVALLLAIFVLPESLHPGSESAARRRFNKTAIHEAVSVPSIGLLLLAMFIVVFSFSNLETTLSLILKGQPGIETPFRLSVRDVLLTFAFIGLVLAVVQGGLVRPLSGRVSEVALASVGSLLEIVSFVWIIFILRSPHPSMPAVYGMLALCTAGFAFITPSLNSLLSRRSDPAKQGAILGLGQSVSSLARIVGSGLGIPLLMQSVLLPYMVAGGLMVVGLLLVLLAGASGKDYAKSEATILH